MKKHILVLIFLIFASPAYAERFFALDSTWYTKIADRTNCLTNGEETGVGTQPTTCADDSLSVDRIQDVRCYYSATANYPTSGPQCSGNQSFIPVGTGGSPPFWRAIVGDPTTTIMTVECAQNASHSSCTTAEKTWQIQGWDVGLPKPGGSDFQTGNQTMRLQYFPTADSRGDGKMVVISADGNYAWDFDGAYVFPSDYNTTTYPNSSGFTCAAPCRLAGKVVAKYVRKWDLSTDGVTNLTWPYDGLSMPSSAKIGNVHGTITHDEAVAGTIDHALSFVTRGSRKELQDGVYPAGVTGVGGWICTTASCNTSNPTLKYRSIATTGTLPLLIGQRVYLPAATNCEEITKSFVKAVCKAARDYGMIWRDNSGEGYVNFQLENQAGKAWVWSSLFTTTDFYDGETAAGRIPWHDLKVTLPILPNDNVCFTGSDTEPPTTPTSLTGTAASSTGTNVSWAASTDNCAIVKYNVERCEGATCTNFAMISSTITSTSIVDSGLSSSTTYRYKVIAFDPANNYSSYSSIVPVTTSSQPTASNYHVHNPTAALSITTEDCTDFATAGADSKDFQLSPSGPVVASLYLLADDIGLYYCFTAADTDIWADLSDDGALSTQDSIELSFDVNAAGSVPTYKFIFSPAGAITDVNEGSDTWDATRIRHEPYYTGSLNDFLEDTSWTVKGIIVWGDWGVTKPSTGTTWSFDARWNRKTYDSLGSKDLYNTDGGSFEDVAGFGTLEFMDIPKHIKLKTP